MIVGAEVGPVDLLAGVNNPAEPQCEGRQVAAEIEAAGGQAAPFLNELIKRSGIFTSDEGERAFGQLIEPLDSQSAHMTGLVAELSIYLIAQWLARLRSFEIVGEYCKAAIDISIRSIGGHVRKDHQIWDVP